MSTESRVRKPQQDRSRESLERVLAAGLDILIEEGWHDLTLARVCERAGVTVGMLYRRFHGREELLAALQTRWIDDLGESLEEMKALAIAWEEIDAEQAVRVAIHRFADSFRDNETKTRVFGLHGAFDDTGLRRLQAISSGYAAWFRGVLLHHRSAITHPNPERAVDFSFRLIIDTMIRRTTYGDEFDTGSPIGDWREFADELCTVCIAYLFRAFASEAGAAL